MKPHGLPRLLLIAAVCFVAMIVAFYLFTGWRGRTAWEACEKDARSRGVKLSVSEYLPPKIPDEENFASIPLFMGGAPADFRLVGRPRKNSGPDPQLATRTDLAGWRSLLVEKGALPADAPAEPADAVLSYLERFEPAMAQLREAAGRPKCRFPSEWEKGFSAGIPYIRLLMSAAQINALRMEAHIAKRGGAAAYADFQLGLRMAGALEQELSLVNGLVHLAILQLALNSIWSGLDAEVWDDEILGRIEVDLEPLSPLRHYPFVMNSERAIQNTFYQRLRDGHDDELRRMISFMGLNEKAVGIATELVPRGWFYDNQLAFNQFTDEMLTEVDFRRWVFTPKPELWATERFRGGNILHRTRYALFIVTAPVMSGVAEKFCLAETRVRQAQIACALERFRHTTGKYPESLGPLVPTYLSIISHDVMDGKPMRFRQEPGGRFTLYSLGENKKDDGGVIDLKARPNQQLDWIWTYPAPTPAPPAP